MESPVGRRPKPGAFAAAVLDECRRLELPSGGGPVVVAVSGGADSTALLLAVDELLRAELLKTIPVVAHLDHGLRGEEAREDARWVERLARELGYEVEVGQAFLGEATGPQNLEQAARRARYDFLKGVAERRGARVVLTGHTLDDQAETVLLRLMRGSGADGLGGMEAARPLTEGSEILLVRPLLGWARRALTEEYCRARGVGYRADAMNEDESFSRVRLRRRLLPLMRTFNPRVSEALARTAALLREDAAALNASAEQLLERAASEGKGLRDQPAPGSLDVETLAAAHTAVRRRALRVWIARARGGLRRVESVHLAAVEKLLEGTRGGRVAELPGGSFVERRRGRLWFHVRPE